MTYPPGYNCCCQCYYISPYVCCGGDPGPVRYRVRSGSSVLATFAASGDPFFAIIKPQGFEIDLDYIAFAITDIEWAGGDLDYQAECWLVEASDDCDEGELIDWIEFDAVQSNETASIGFYEKGNVEEATVFYDPDLYATPEECEPGNLDNCPVKCEGACYSATATAEFRLQCTLVLDDASTQAIDITNSGRMFDDDCDQRAFGDGVGGDIGLSMFGCDDAFAYKNLVLPGPTRNVGITFADDNTATITDNLWDSGTGRTVASVTDITITRTRTSAVAWTTDGGGNCVVEEAP